MQILNHSWMPRVRVQACWFPEAETRSSCVLGLAVGGTSLLCLPCLCLLRPVPCPWAKRASGALPHSAEKPLALLGRQEGLRALVIFCPLVGGGPMTCPEL